jgi:hypothetical protein
MRSCYLADLTLLALHWVAELLGGSNARFCNILPCIDKVVAWLASQRIRFDIFLCIYPTSQRYPALLQDILLFRRQSTNGRKGKFTATTLRYKPAVRRISPPLLISGKVILDSPT